MSRRDAITLVVMLVLIILALVAGVLRLKAM